VNAVRPPQPKKTTKPRRAPAGSAPSGEVAGPFPERRPLKPIGPAALRALREQIRTGRYPSDAVVRSGLERLLRPQPSDEGADPRGE
jgi:hypothetical protein